MDILQAVLPGMAAALFLWGAAVCVRRLFWPDLEVPAPSPACKGEYVRVLAACLCAGLCFITLFSVCALRQYPGQGLAAAVQRFFGQNIDSNSYVGLAQYGYGTGSSELWPEQTVQIVFFPLFPALLRVVSLGGRLPLHLAGFLLQIPLFCWAGTALYALLRRNYGPGAARWALAFLLAAPGALFFFTPMTESLFLALSVSFFLALEKDRPAAAGWLGLLAALCRSPGALLAGAAAAWYILCWRREKSAPRPAALWPVAAPALGLGMYLLLNWRVYGNWFQFAVYQKEHWHQGPGFFTDTVRYHLDYFASWWAGGNRAGALFISLAAVCIILCSLVLLALTAKKLAVHHLAYGLAYLAFTMGATWLLSAPRYAEGLFLLPAALALTARRRATRWLVLAVLAVLGAVYTVEFIRHGPIY